MYLARYSTEAGDVVQGAARVTPAVPTRADEAWDGIARFCREALPMTAATVARRVVLEGGRLSEVLAVTVAERDERSVRALFARLTRLEPLRAGTVALPQSREEHDGFLGDVPPLRFAGGREPFAVGGIRVACDWRLQSVLGPLIAWAASTGERLCYQIHLRAFEPSASDARAARRNVLALAAIPGAPAPLTAWQQDLGRRLVSAVALCEEFIAVDSPDAADAVASALRDAFRLRFCSHGFSTPSMRLERGIAEELLTSAIHSHDLSPADPIELCGACVDVEERETLLSWKPPAASLRALGEVQTPEPEEAAGAMPPLDGMPAPYDGTAPFAFVSYKREDLPRIAPIVQRVVRAGLPIWFDKGIPGGAEWDAVIEERLSACAMLLLFASPAALQSKYVRREVKFADALGLPILTISMEDAVMGHGMRMLLTQYQRLDARAADFDAQLARALAAAAV